MDKCVTEWLRSFVSNDTSSSRLLTLKRIIVRRLSFQHQKHLFSNVDTIEVERNMTSAKPMIPAEFICPITMELMVNPLVSRYGHNFEMEAIIAWLRNGSQECPITRQPLSFSDLIHNNQMANEIETWHQLHGESRRTSALGDESVDSYDADKMIQIYGSDDMPFAEPVSNTTESMLHEGRAKASPHSTRNQSCRNLPTKSFRLRLLPFRLAALSKA